jgi:sugar phosphate isomerase/epimerase
MGGKVVVVEGSAHVILSGFSDEATSSKNFREQLAVIAALGLKYLAIRFLDVGFGCKNAMDLAWEEVQQAVRFLSEYDVRVSSLGSPLGKVKLLNIDDGTANRYVPFEEYLRQDVAHACRLAHALEVRLVRAFSFYPPRGGRPEEYLNQATDQLGRMADLFHKEGLTLGLEVEANLVGYSGRTLRQIHQHLCHPSVVLVFDAANLVMQGLSSNQVLEEYHQMRPALGWLHIKDYRTVTGQIPGEYVREDEASDFVPAGCGEGAYLPILQDVRHRLNEMVVSMQARGAPGLFLELEPHLRGGGQFGGYSGPDGFGVALRSLCGLLDQVELPYRLRQASDLTPSVTQ